MRNVVRSFDTLFAEMEKELALLPVEGYQQAVLLIGQYIGRVREQAAKGFPSEEVELGYYRVTWVRFYGRLFFYLLMQGFTSRWAYIAQEDKAAALAAEEKRIGRFFWKHRDFWRDYQAGSPVMGGLFTQSGSAACWYEPLAWVLGEGATLASYRAAWCWGYEEFRGWLGRERLRLLEPAGALSVDMEWRGSDADAVEWLYGLQAAKVVHLRGEPADIRNLAAWFKGSFGRDILNIYDRFKVIRNRKKDRTPFFRRMWAALERRMDEADGKFE